MTLLKIAVREYYCPLCGRKENHSTNHAGEIYTPCQDCGHSVLYCSDAEQDLRTAPGDASAVLRAYQFSMENPAEKAEYKALRLRLEGMGYVCFATHDFGGRTKRHWSTMNVWHAHAGETLQLFNPAEFTGQYVCNLGRVHDWEEAVYPNKKIKKGYYLEHVKEAK